MKYKLIIDQNAEEEIIVTAHSVSPLIQKIENLISSFSGPDYIIGYKDDEICKLEIKDIECFTVYDRKVIAIDKYAQKYRIRDRLRDLEVVLPSYFVRINKSAIANENSILRFKTVFSGGVDAIFKCGYKEYVSRRCFGDIRRRYENI